MSGFSAAWLALREPADVSARAGDVTTFVVGALQGRPTCRIVDLGSGTGSNVRYLSPRLPPRQTWRLVDNDAVLLAAAQSRIALPIETCLTDLRELDDALLAGCDLVTASALLDLVSEPWLARFIQSCRRVGAAVLVALNYDGRITCTPADHDDEFVRGLVNAHQRTDKGFGPALGPESGPRVDALLREGGYEVRRAKSDWLLGADHDGLQRELVAGWAGAAVELSPASEARVRAWQKRRIAHIDQGTSHITVGHEDVGGVLRAL